MSGGRSSISSLPLIPSKTWVKCFGIFFLLLDKKWCIYRFLASLNYACHTIQFLGHQSIRSKKRSWRNRGLSVPRVLPQVELGPSTREAPRFLGFSSSRFDHLHPSTGVMWAPSFDTVLRISRMPMKLSSSHPSVRTFLTVVPKVSSQVTHLSKSVE